MKFCKDCKYYHTDKPYDWCSGPHVPPSLVTGIRSMALPTARLSGFSGLVYGKKCGEEALMWEPKEPDSYLGQFLGRLVK